MVSNSYDRAMGRTIIVGNMFSKSGSDVSWTKAKYVRLYFSCITKVDVSNIVLKYHQLDTSVDGYCIMACDF